MRLRLYRRLCLMMSLVGTAPCVGTAMPGPISTHATMNRPAELAAVSVHALVGSMGDSTKRSVGVALTDEMIEHWIALQRAVQTLPDSVRSTIPLQTVLLRDWAPDLGTDSTPFMNWGASASRQPLVATAFAQAKLAPDAYVPTTVQILTAVAVLRMWDVMEKVGTSVKRPNPPRTLVDSNVAIVAPHLQALTAVGLDKVTELITESGPTGMAAPALFVDSWLNADSTPAYQLGPFSMKEGQVYVLAFTASWCGACSYIYGPLQDIAQQYAKQGVHVVLVTSAYPSLADLTSYLKNHEVKVPVLVEGKGEFGENAKRFSITSLPVVVVVDQHGVIRHRWEGATTDTEAYREALRAAIGKTLTAP